MKQQHNINYNPIIKLQQLERQISRLIALCETLVERLDQEQQKTDQKFLNFDQNINHQISKIKQVLKEITAIMTQTGVARWRMAAELALKDGQHHYQSLLQTCQQFERLTKQTCQKLEQLVCQAQQRMKTAAHLFRIEDFQRMIRQNTQHIDHTTISAIQRINTAIRWIHCEKFAIALIVAIVVSILSSLFIMDEFPWESHSKISAERKAGEILLQAWPKLTEQEQARIDQLSEEPIN